MLKHIINSHCVFNIGDSGVDLLPHHHNFQVLWPKMRKDFSTYWVQNCLSQVKISETVYSLSGFWNCVFWKRQTTGFLFTPEIREEAWPPTPDPPMSNTLNIAPSYGQFTLVSGRDGLILRWLDVKMAWCWVRWLAPRWHWWLARPGIPFIWAARAEKVRSVRSEHF